MKDHVVLCSSICKIAKEASLAILKIYQGSDFSVTNKAPGDPLTAADLASHNIILNRLQTLTPSIPIISEEASVLDYTVRSQWPLLWLVDPLDGTKEFIKKNGEFTVNIALISERAPILGVVAAPALNEMYYGVVGAGAWKASLDEKIPAIQLHPRSTEPTAPLTVVLSKSHRESLEERFLAECKIGEMKTIGSSLKFCLVAAGEADFYIRGGPTSEWDTAAGHAILRSVGGEVTTKGVPLSYNKENLRNPGFLCCASYVLQEHLLSKRCLI